MVTRLYHMWLFEAQAALTLPVPLDLAGAVFSIGDDVIPCDE